MTEVQEQMAAADMVAEGSPAVPAADPTPIPVQRAKVLISAGRIVLYTLSQSDADQINRRRGANVREESWPKGAVAHFGNYANAGDVVPVIVVRVWNDNGVLNGQAFLDGNDTLWLTSVSPAETEGQQGRWFWPSRVS